MAHFQNDDLVQFETFGMDQELITNGFEDLVNHDGQYATITGLEMDNSFGTGKNQEYYNIEFEDGAEFIGISGYHLNEPFN